MSRMSISSVAGFNVLFPSGSYSETSSSSSTASLTNASGQNPYQQAVTTLDQWQNQTLTQSLEGNTSAATSALYASAGLNADQFATLATELQKLGPPPAAGSTIDTFA